MPQTPHAYLLPWAQNRFNRFKQKGSGILEAKYINIATEQQSKSRAEHN